MILDEISMVNMASLAKINRACHKARGLSKKHGDFFGALPVVILMGDFFQFPPVQGLPLWKNPIEGNKEQAAGLAVWHEFKDVIILDEQMRQSQDIKFRGILE